MTRSTQLKKVMKESNVKGEMMKGYTNLGHVMKGYTLLRDIIKALVTSSLGLSDY